MTPLDIKDLVFWLDAAIVKTSAEDNTVLRWPDQSDHHFDAVFKPFVINWHSDTRMWHQPPTLSPHAINGLPAVSFNALYGQTLIFVEAAGAMDRKTAGFTILFVCRSRQIQPQKGSKYLFISHNREHYLGEPMEAGSTRFAVIRNGETGAMRMHVRRAKGEQGTNVEVEAKEGQFGDLEWGVSTFTMDYIQRIAIFRYNGRQISSQPMLGSESGESEDTISPIIAIASHSEGNYLTCDIAEMAGYRRVLPEAELGQLEAAMLQKYGLQG
ncbi:MAG: hypothetical protein EXR62_04185 [Chloroflexi bacterium]|nr:hypothetical protein [Chloroflexota bacterium]